MMLDATTATSPDIDAALKRGLLAVLPVGAVEQHGPHLPLLTDTILATGIARSVAGWLDALLLPAIAYGDAWSAEGWAGTLSVAPETLRATIVDLGRGLKRMGATGLITINGHFGNREPIALAARTLSEAGLPVLHLDYPKLDVLAAGIAESAPAGKGFYHADEVETSMMLALAPRSVRMSDAVAEYPAFPETFGAEPMRLSVFNASGVFGDARAATVEKGEALLAGIVEESLRLAATWRARHGI